MCPDGPWNANFTRFSVLIPLISGHVSGLNDEAFISIKLDVLIPLISGHVSGLLDQKNPFKTGPCRDGCQVLGGFGSGLSEQGFVLSDAGS